MIGNKYTTAINENIQEALALREIKDGWKELKKGSDLVLSSTKYKDFELKLAKLEGVIPVNFEKAAKYYFENFDDQKKCREMCDKLVKLEQIDNENVVTLFKTKSKLVVSAREVVGVQNIKRVSPDCILITRTNIPDHPLAPLNKDAVRAQGKVYAIFLTKINENSTQIQAFMLLDPKGSIPTSIVNSMTEKQHEAFVKDVEYIKKM